MGEGVIDLLADGLGREAAKSENSPLLRKRKPATGEKKDAYSGGLGFRNLKNVGLS